jgi:hypothetical protein
LLTDRPLWLCHVDSPLLESALLRRTQIEPAALRRYFSLGKTVAIVGERPNTWRKKPPAIRSGSRTSMTCLPVPTTCNVKSGPASLDLAGSAYLRPFISISRAQQVEEQNIPPILITYGSREFGDRCSAISIVVDLSRVSNKATGRGRSPARGRALGARQHSIVRQKKRSHSAENGRAIMFRSTLGLSLF